MRPIASRFTASVAFIFVLICAFMACCLTAYADEDGKSSSAQPGVDSQMQQSTATPKTEPQASQQKPEGQPAKGSWTWTSKGWKYRVSKSDAQGFVKDGGKTYYLDAKSGIMRTGWVKIDGSWYCFGKSGAMRTGWVWDGAWYYLGPKDGKMLTGRQVIAKKTYFLASSGAMRTGWVKDGGEWYCFDKSGAMRTGWVLSGGKWYWLDRSDEGRMIADANKTIDGKLYSFASSGAMRSNCQIRLEDGKCRYASSSGAISTIGNFDGGKVVLQNSKGKTLTGWQKLAGKWFYADSEGVMQTGWQRSGGKWYWLAKDGAMATESWVDGGKYYVGRNGVWHRYANAAKSKRLVAAAKRVGFQGNGYCARWVDRVYMSAGYPHFDGNARDFYWQRCTISDLEQLEPGMVIGVPSHKRTALGSIYGHVAIYMGNGMVRHNTNKLETVPLSSWISYYQTTYPVKCGWVR